MLNQSQSQLHLERKKEEGGAAAPAAEIVPMYAFRGNVIRINQAQLDQWREAYPFIDIKATLTTADAYYADTPPKGGKWFFAASKWLERENDSKREQSRRTEKERLRASGDAW